MESISGLVITFNEEANIKACLDSLFRVCTEVIVIDSLSTDRTVEIAASAGAKVYLQKFLGDGPQRSFGLHYCSNTWVLNLDADERLDEDAAAAIRNLDLTETDYDAFEFRRKNILHGRWVKVAGWYPDYIRRLFNRQRTDFSPVHTHSKIVARRSKKVNAHIIHFSFGSYRDMIKILNRYSDWQARTLVGKNQKVSALSPFGHGFFSFTKHYFIKRGFLAGLDGFVIATLNALGSFFKYAKALELYRYSKGEEGWSRPSPPVEI
jgi:glycosyltransferase involved in cell wall biosynthesis